MQSAKIMIYNIIGPPGSGKTTYIKRRFGFSPPMRTIDSEVFEDFVRRKVFEHTGLNIRINRHLDTLGENITTIWFQGTRSVCFYRILRDFFRRNASLKQTRDRLIILSYYFRHFHEIRTDVGGPGNKVIVVPAKRPVAECVDRVRRRLWKG